MLPQAIVFKGNTPEKQPRSAEASRLRGFGKLGRIRCDFDSLVQDGIRCLGFIQRGDVGEGREPARRAPRTCLYSGSIAALSGKPFSRARSTTVATFVSATSKG